jgi:hypothetical protein
MARLALAVPILLALCATPPARAAEAKPFQLALVDPIQIVPASQSISGIRLTLLWTKNVDVTGFDFSFIAGQTTGNFKGLQLMPVGIVEKDLLGIQADMVAITGGTMKGAQLGFFNKAKRVEGLQLGFVNYTGTINGLQIGLVNIIEKGGWLPVMVIVNGHFD